MATATEERTTVTFNPGTDEEHTVPLEGVEEGVRKVVGGLFDPEPYTLPVPRVDGQAADAIELVFSGKVVLDPQNEDDLALIERLKLDSDYTFTVEAAIAGKAFKIKRTEEETVATHAVTCRVHTLYREGEVGG